MNKLIQQTSFLFSHWFFCPSVGIPIFFFPLSLRYVKGCPHCLCRCFHNFFQQTWFLEENGITKKFSLSTTLGHGWCQNQWFMLFPLPSRAITGQRSVRLRRFKTACCSRLNRPQAGTTLVVPESALNFHLGQSTPLHPGAPIIPCLLPIKRRIPYFLSNESSEEWNESFPFQWIFRRRRAIQLPLWGSSIQQRSTSILSATPACACADHPCAHTFEGQGSLQNCTVSYSDCFLRPWETLSVLGWLNYLLLETCWEC